MLSPISGQQINGVSKTVIQGFGEDDQKRFADQIGPVISYLAINNTEGIIHVAEKHSSAAKQIKTIKLLQVKWWIGWHPTEPVLCRCLYGSVYG